MNKQIHRSSLVLLLLLLGAGGCADTGTDGSAPDLAPQAPVEGAQQPIRNGTWEPGHRGVVELHDVLGYSCTGVMISPYYLLTAGHCLNQLKNQGLQEGWVNNDVWYHDPYGGGLRLVANQSDGMYAWMHHFYFGEEDNQAYDIGLIRIVQWDFNIDWYQSWFQTNEDDYLRLSLGDCNQIDRSTLYGTGLLHYDGRSDDELYSMPVNVETCWTKYFYSSEGDQSVCKGDSGGPYVVDVDGVEIVSGLAVAVQVKNSGQNCATGNGAQYATRIEGEKVRWIEDKMQVFDAAQGGCQRGTTSSGHPFARCWQ